MNGRISLGVRGLDELGVPFEQSRHGLKVPALSSFQDRGRRGLLSGGRKDTDEQDRKDADSMLHRHSLLNRDVNTLYG